MQDKANEVVSNSNNKLGGFTITAIVMAAIGFLLNPFCILSIMGTIFSGIGIAHSSNNKDKTWAIIMLSLSVVETLFWVGFMVNTMAAL
ncbi:hypothetical protein [Schleiferilactobacillus harbinensis]|uniref:hypothetical protein n=1 Tax=Schleiferilactobacillus harbinensis TaxID=304207 RepID=UPI001169BE3A|nr:hypothetical protein [Schleiferilactobacillus harbinensis]GEK06644.1 hypothetical protein LHA01_18830 [Schleiferilactobacillus harbinensis]